MQQLKRALRLFDKSTSHAKHIVDQGHEIGTFHNRLEFIICLVTPVWYILDSDET